ncbi:ParB/RepB/Spo0J family partition protein [Pseudohaliea rubra]|uniref:Probable chromosome-partitioning protein ParB n=1 Tax=Pseudohaliea rubra DSM 19751 TaxID=1265313 RepID=A0A095XXI5_9GAMM|nr:ParB/RepB/Spo0J family partition protein [Pseudohaliea rubra]KGE04441.1 Chromosome (plasmid) partitioning protein ParB / Stage 0 sporulation protein J [Pseudohaliea rubra DSM 19751]
MAGKKARMGRGLDALLASSASAAGREQAPAPTESDGELRDVPVDLIQRGKYQPRKDIEPESLQELAESIKAQGLMQPIVIRPISDKRYEIIAGERRWRAAQLAGLGEIPALVRDVPDEAAIAMALIENIQREDLNPIEEAVALERLQREFELTQQEVADAVGKSRSTIANLLRLMSLEPEVRTLLEHGDIDMGHARCLLALSGVAQCQAARQVASRSLSVRQAEALVRRLLADAQQSAGESPAIDPNIRSLQDDLAERLGTRVQIQHGKGGKGRLVLSYNSLDELDGILGHIQ